MSDDWAFCKMRRTPSSSPTLNPSASPTTNPPTSAPTPLNAAGAGISVNEDGGGAATRYRARRRARHAAYSGMRTVRFRMSVGRSRRRACTRSSAGATTRRLAGSRAGCRTRSNAGASTWRRTWCSAGCRTRCLDDSGVRAVRFRRSVGWSRRRACTRSSAGATTRRRAGSRAGCRTRSSAGASTWRRSWCSAGRRTWCLTDSGMRAMRFRRSVGRRAQ